MPRRLSFGMWAAFALGDNEALRTLGDEYLALARRGALNHLTVALHYLGMVELRIGTLTGAAAYGQQQADVQQWFANPSGNIDDLLVLAWRGDEAATRASAAMIADLASESRRGWSATRHQRD